ncbi:N-acetylglutamate synthase-like GNAT family acetyltransferase [Microvirga flocculans]|uniref:N-acetylglutamate synthase-like GNAT family acetyltransferase n=1 Tax=Microvirga flocculans TaxID=217168 RepID=A0A7W6II41_9HYPH|nr:GNAT family N-acetyltransferase [Microvirga flocculans]MBB4041886.1 N-acetylglutamate synthase-like GNAT family acetyltransferase [Microvirga flocculans]
MSRWTISNSLSPAELEKAYRWISGESYWAKDLPRAFFERSVANSLCFALRDTAGELRGFARVVTDKATFAYLCDVFICPSIRGQGAGKALIGVIMEHPDLQDLRRWMLATRDAHGLYAQYGFSPLENPERLMQRLDHDVYARLSS